MKDINYRVHMQIVVSKLDLDDKEIQKIRIRKKSMHITMNKSAVLAEVEFVIAILFYVIRENVPKNVFLSHTLR